MALDMQNAMMVPAEQLYFRKNRIYNDRYIHGNNNYKNSNKI